MAACDKLCPNGYHINIQHNSSDLTNIVIYAHKYLHDKSATWTVQYSHVISSVNFHSMFAYNLIISLSIELQGQSETEMVKDTTTFDFTVKTADFSRVTLA